MTLQVQLVSPESLLFEGQAELVVARTTDGEIGIQTGHIPFVGALLPSHVRVQQPDGTKQHIAVHGGFIQIYGEQLTILSDVAELAEDIDVARATAAKERAEAALSADGDDAIAAEALKRAMARLATAGHD